MTATSRLPGLALLGVVGAFAVAAGRLVPLVGAPVIGVVLGVAVSRLADRPAFVPGRRLAGQVALPSAIVLLGSQLSLAQAARVGASSLPVMAATLAVCLGLAVVVGRRLGIGTDLHTLIGVGTGICGASAIAAVSPVIRARSAAVSYAMSTIFLFNVAAVLAFPPVGHLLGLPQHAFGLFAGTAVNDTSSVVAAAAAYGPAAARTAVVVKLTRSLMIVPVCLVLALVTRGRRGTSRRPGRMVPWFLIGFVVLMAANSCGVVPAGAHPALGGIAGALVTVALVGIGASTDVAAMRRTGNRPLLLGFVLWLAVSATSLGVQALM